MLKPNPKQIKTLEIQMFYSLEHFCFGYCFGFRASARPGATLLKKVRWRCDISEEGHIEPQQ